MKSKHRERKCLWCDNRAICAMQNSSVGGKELSYSNFQIRTQPDLCYRCALAVKPRPYIDTDMDIATYHAIQTQDIMPRRTVLLVYKRWHAEHLIDGYITDKPYKGGTHDDTTG